MRKATSRVSPTHTEPTSYSAPSGRSTPPATTSAGATPLPCKIADAAFTVRLALKAPASSGANRTVKSTVAPGARAQGNAG